MRYGEAILPTFICTSDAKCIEQPKSDWVPGHGRIDDVEDPKTVLPQFGTPAHWVPVNNLDYT